MQRERQPLHRHRSSRRRSSSDNVFRLEDLPYELRLLVLEFSLPAVNDVSRHWPAPIPALLRTSRQINSDTKAVMTRWSPTHYVPSPDYLDLIPFPGPVRVEDICLSMFHDARIGVMRSGLELGTPQADHQELVTQWEDHVYRLPRFESIKSISIDATPAPGWLRYDKPAWVTSLINDKPVSDRFVYEHIAVIADLTANIISFYNSIDHPITVNLAGVYGQRSRTFPHYIQRRCARGNLDVKFTGTIESDSYYHGSRISIEDAINELYSTRSIPADRYRREMSRILSDKRRLTNNYVYSPTSEFLFENCYQEDEYWTMQALEQLTDFTLDANDDDRPRHIDIRIPDFSRGAFICALAKDLRLITTPRNSWRRKEIRISARSGRRRTRQATKESSTSSSVFSLLLLSAAAVLFVGILSSDARRRR